jgi:hypothetical protein
VVYPSKTVCCHLLTPWAMRSEIRAAAGRRVHRRARLREKILTPSIVALRQWVTIVAAWMGASALAGAGAAMGERSEKCDGKGGQRHLIEGARFAADSLRWWGGIRTLGPRERGQ